MKFAIFTHVNHICEEGKYWAYGPYVKEMNVWSKYVDEVIIVAPLSQGKKLKIDLPYDHDNLTFQKIPSFSLLSVKSVLNAIMVFPQIFLKTFIAMQKADHIHLRCPGNVGLIASLVQIFFPNTPKTAKYAGNWDPNSNQPWSYRLQKWILSNTFLTRNMNVLVYGEWERSTINIKPFFTATYKDADKEGTLSRELKETTRFLFVGALSKGKRPMYAIDLLKKIKEKGTAVSLDIFGEGTERKPIQDFINENQLNDCVILHGNQPSDVVESAYKSSHFLLLPSQSEGWPKVVAEAMFWGCVPVSTNVSCVPYMLDKGSRGVLLSLNLNNDTEKIHSLLKSPSSYSDMAEKGMVWSREFTLDKFEQAIGDLLQSTAR